MKADFRAVEAGLQELSKMHHQHAAMQSTLAQASSDCQEKEDRLEAIDDVQLKTAECIDLKQSELAITKAELQRVRYEQSQLVVVDVLVFHFVEYTIWVAFFVNVADAPLE
jgi:hypothetical protein